MACYPNNAATDIIQNEHAAREAALQRLSDSVAPDVAAEVAGDEAFFEFRRGVLHRPGMTSAVLFNNNPCFFREAEWTELKRLLDGNGYVVAGEGQSPAEGQVDAGYTLALVVRRADGAPVGAGDPAVLADLMADALRNIGQAEQLHYHEIRIED